MDKVELMCAYSLTFMISFFMPWASINKRVLFLVPLRKPVLLPWCKTQSPFLLATPDNDYGGKDFEWPTRSSGAAVQRDPGVPDRACRPPAGPARRYANAEPRRSDRPSRCGVASPTHALCPSAPLRAPRPVAMATVPHSARSHGN